MHNYYFDVNSFRILADKSRVLLSGEFPDYIHAVAANVSYLLARSL